MTRKRDKKTQPELEQLEREHMMDKLREMENQRRQAYLEFVKSAQGLEPLGRAEAWLDHIANDASNWNDYGGYGAEEAVVYLVSRGHDCAEHIKGMLAAWKLAERYAIERCMQGRTVHELDTGETHRKGGMSYAEASDILNLSLYELPNFWSGFDHQEFSIDATMLRTVEWCNIGGFDQWWLRLAKEHFEMTIQGGIEPVPASFFLFNMCRSDYAIGLMDKTLIRMLEAIELPEHKQSYPWRRWRWTDPPQAVDHLAYAASIAFADERLRPHHNDIELVNQALEALLKHQDIEGSWRCWADGKEPSIDTTAMAIHALALKKPRGWELGASAARDWLWSVQDRSGCWIDRGCPDSIYLTVLVLDALELAEGGSRVTFGLTRPFVRERSVQMHMPEIAQEIEQWIPKQRFRSEEAYEAALAEYLEGRGIAAPEQQGACLVDILAAHSTGIEIKLKPNRSEYDRLVGQVKRHLGEYDNVIVLIIQPDKRDLLKEYMSLFADDSRVVFITK